MTLFARARASRVKVELGNDKEGGRGYSEIKLSSCWVMVRDVKKRN